MRCVWTVRTPGMGHADASGRRGPLRFQPAAVRTDMEFGGSRGRDWVRQGKGTSPRLVRTI